MKMDNSKDRKETEQESVVSKILKIVTYPLAAFLGYNVTSTHINDSAYNKLKDLNAFGAKGPEEAKRVHEALQKMGVDTAEFDAYSNKIWEHRLKNKGIVAQANVKIAKELDATDTVEKISEEMDKFNPVIQDTMRKMGFTNIFKEWKIVNPSQRTHAVTEGLTIAGVTIGALLSIANSKTVTKVLASHDNAEDKQNNSGHSL